MKRFAVAVILILVSVSLFAQTVSNVVAGQEGNNVVVPAPTATTGLRRFKTSETLISLCFSILAKSASTAQSVTTGSQFVLS